MSNALKAIIIDTDQTSVLTFGNFARNNNHILDICGSAMTMQEALPLIQERKAEVLFMNPTTHNLKDYQLLNSLDFVPPKVVFISKYKEQAYEAYKLRAVDFLMKPLSFSDIFLSIYAITKLLAMESALQNEKVKEINSINALYQNKEYLSIGAMDKIDLVKISEIIYCKADGKYTEFALVDGTQLVSSKNLGEYQSILEDNTFYRIHHSYIINIKHIKRITKGDGLYCEFINGVKLPIAKRRQEGFSKFINL